MIEHVSEERLMAFLDGELDEISAGRVRKAIAEDPALAAALAEQRRLKAWLARRFDPIAEEEVPERFRAMLETNVVPLGAVRRRPQWRTAAAIAASFVAGVLTVQALPGGGGPDGSDGGAPMIARGALAEALETQLASAQRKPGDARIGVTFASLDGRVCRTFDTSAMAGLACRGGKGWELLTTARTSPVPGAEYRQAGSGSALVMQAAQEMMAGEPLDAAAERAARGRGWRTGNRSAGQGLRRLMDRDAE
jgi:anti-sigma factor RsiW